MLIFLYWWHIQILLFWVYLVKYIVKVTSRFFKEAIRKLKPICVSQGACRSHWWRRRPETLGTCISSTVTCRLLRGSRANRTPDISNNLTCRLSWGRAMIFWPTHTLILQREKEVPYKRVTAPQYSILYTLHGKHNSEYYVSAALGCRDQAAYTIHMCSMSLKQRGHNWFILILRAHYTNLIVYLSFSVYEYWICTRGSMTNISPGIKTTLPRFI